MNEAPSYEELKDAGETWVQFKVVRACVIESISGLEYEDTISSSLSYDTEVMASENNRNVGFTCESIRLVERQEESILNKSGKYPFGNLRNEQVTLLVTPVQMERMISNIPLLKIGEIQFTITFPDIIADELLKVVPVLSYTYCAEVTSS